MSEKFILQGNRNLTRTKEEMLTVDSEAADCAYKKYSKEIFGEYLKQHRFCKYGSKAYVRRSPIDLLEYVDLQKERYGSRTFTVNFYIMPLYVPMEFISTCLGNRLGELIAKKDIWWDYADDDTAKVSFQNVTDAIEQFVLPWFEYFSDEKTYIRQLKRIKKESWITAAMDMSDRTAVIADNIKNLRLPAKLFR